MVTTVLQGGLGNQMFQSAATLNVAKKGNDGAIFSRSSHYLPLQGRDVSNYEDNVFRNLSFTNKVSYSKIVEEASHVYEPIEYEEGVCLRGYFQSEKYFQEHEKEIIETLKPIDRMEELAQKEFSDDCSTVAVHIRRGDYLQFSDTHPPLSETDYYEVALSGIDDVDEKEFYICSDDMYWCRNNLEFIPNKKFAPEDLQDWEELYLMSYADQVIICNSSFSWWSAKFGEELGSMKGEDVIAPSNKIWFGPKGPRETDIVPEERWRIIDG